jgi:hypothetical protein
MTTPTRTGPAPGASPSRKTVPIGSILLIIAGALISLLALAVLAAGGAMTWAYGTQRDADGYFTTPDERFETTTYAIASERVDLGAPNDGATPVNLGDLAEIQLRAASTNGRSVFVGIAPQDEVDRFLADTPHAVLDEVRFAPFSATYRYIDGASSPPRPGGSSIWVASSEGEGTQTVQWEPRTGRWSVVVMNADASPGVSVTAAAGARAGWVLPVGIGLLVGGVLGLVLGAAMLVIGVLALARGTMIDLTGPETHPSQPVRLEGHADPAPSRWLWLVKWLLLIPHLIILAVLWVAFTLVTVVAFFSILFTGRYPRALFDFNVGVLRWTWRVNYYGYSALATDRYPPFSLGHEPDYPATLEVAYPERLSRGLVLVKWWLLAIPHYLVLAVFVGGAVSVFGWRWSGGLIGLLVLFAAVALLFTGHYPAGIHDLVVGLNRWVYRVITYVALMRDEYPPFRLDQGSDEVPPPSPPDRPTAAAERTEELASH